MAALAASQAGAQRLRIVSEFQRVRPDGEVYSLDRVDRPREILSPAVARNSWATFRVLVEAPPGAAYTIYIAQNPDDTVQAKLYEETTVLAGDEMAPDGLKLVTHPVTAYFPKDKKVQTYLLDVRVPDDAPPKRFRLEVQLWAVDRWIIYPMEVRVREIMVPANPGPAHSLPAVRERSDAALDEAVREWACLEKPNEEAPAVPFNARALLARNARNDIAILRVRENEEPRDGILAFLLKAGGWKDLDSLCAKRQPAPNGAEWWLRFRDYLYQSLPVR